MGITEKQANILLKAGWTEEQIENTPYGDLSAAIGEILARQKPKANQFHKEVRQPQTEKIESIGLGWTRTPYAPKTQNYDKVSYYVSYAKDIACKMLEMQAQYISAGIMKLEQASDVGTIMSQAILCIKQARKEFE